MRRGAVLAVLIALSGCDFYHNPADASKIKDLQDQLTQANARADAAEVKLHDDQHAMQDRLAAAAEASARAQEEQAAAQQDRITASALRGR